MAYSLVLAFASVKDVAAMKLEFVMLDNFRQALVNDVEFLPALYSSLADLLNIPVIIAFSLFLAILLNKKIKGRGFFRAMFLLPVLLGTGVVMEALQGNGSQVSVAMGAAAQSAGLSKGISFQDLVLNEQLKTLLGSGISATVGEIINRINSLMWLSGIQIIIFLGVLQTIPDALYEASVIDGASEFDKLWKITIPLSMPAILLNVVYSVIDSFTNTSNKVIGYISKVSFSNFMLSYGSALSWMYFLIIGILLSVIFLLMRKRTFYLG